MCFVHAPEIAIAPSLELRTPLVQEFNVLGGYCVLSRRDALMTE